MFRGTPQAEPVTGLGYPTRKDMGPEAGVRHGKDIGLEAGMGPGTRDWGTLSCVNREMHVKTYHPVVLRMRTVSYLVWL